MSSIALANDYFANAQTLPTSFDAAVDLRRLSPRKPKVRRSISASQPWTEIAVVGAANPPVLRNPKVPSYVWLLVASVAAAHGIFAWYSATHKAASTVVAHRAEVALEFERVKPPEPPKVEPPKPIPSRPQIQRPAQVLPTIQQAAPDTPASPGVSSEPPIAVAPTAATPAEVPIIPARGSAGYLNNPPPDYPPQAARQGWEGTVLLRVRVLTGGTAESVAIEKSSGKKVLDDEAVRTVKKWLFVPAKRGDSPIDGWATVPIEFKVEQ